MINYRRRKQLCGEYSVDMVKYSKRRRGVTQIFLFMLFREKCERQIYDAAKTGLK